MRTKKSFLDKIESILHNFLRAEIWWKKKKKKKNRSDSSFSREQQKSLQIFYPVTIPKQDHFHRQCRQCLVFFQVGNNDMKMRLLTLIWCYCCLLWTNITTFSIIFIFSFEQANRRLCNTSLIILLFPVFLL